MKRKQAEFKTRLVQKYIAFVLATTTLIITPFVNYEAVSLPKLLLVAGCSFSLFPIILSSLSKNISLQVKIVVSTAVLFLIILFTSLLNSETPASRQFFGVLGRNTGLLTYISLILLMLAAYFFADNFLTSYLVKALLITGLLNMFYGFLQFFGYDFASWNNQLNSILTTLGNPNFASAHLAFCTISAFSLLLDSKYNYLQKTIFTFYMIGNSILIYLSESQQGLFLLALVLPLLVILKLRTVIFSKSIPLLILALYLIFGLISLLGIFNLGPFRSFLYQRSFEHRVDMWKIALKMISDNPLFGVGIDSYGDWFATYADRSYYLEWGDTPSDAAHNVFLDLISSAGITVLIPITLTLSFSIISAYRRIKFLNSFNGVHMSILSVALAYLAQAMISINHIGLAVWGFVFVGIILGLNRDINSKKILDSDLTRKSKNQDEFMGAAYFGKPIFFLLLLVGLFLGNQPFSKDIGFKSSIAGSSVELVGLSLDKFPKDGEYYRTAAQIAFDNSLYDVGYTWLKKAVAFNERDLYAWKLQLNYPNLLPQDRELIEKRIGVLMPSSSKS